MTAWSITEVPVPATLDEPEAVVLRAYSKVRNAVIEESWGVDDFHRSVPDELGSLHDQKYVRKLRFVAGPEGGDPWGYLAMNLPLQDNTHQATFDMGVLREHQGQGLGSALHDKALAVARAAGRTTVQTSVDQQVEPPEGPTTLSPSTGSGRVDTEDRSTRFALKRGWELAQVARYSVLQLPLDAAALAAQRAAAQERAGDEYRMVSWGTHSPEEWLDEYAKLNTRMSTDVPLGDLDYEEDVWDGARVRTTEAQFAERGFELIVTAAEHVPTRTLAAYTVLLALPHTDRYVAQEDTLVIREHRGRRLGMLVKAANLELLARERPTVRRVGTWNAEENSFMLDINVALGFRPAGGSGEWQLRLT
jgi:GNAT superfamily N-acetyltransferase